MPKPKFIDRRRKHQHYKCTITYQDGGKFTRVYLSREAAKQFAERQKRSPVVKATRIEEVRYKTL
jgi:hypothetical protein